MGRGRCVSSAKKYDPLPKVFTEGALRPQNYCVVQVIWKGVMSLSHACNAYYVIIIYQIIICNIIISKVVSHNYKIDGKELIKFIYFFLYYTHS